MTHLRPQMVQVLLFYINFVSRPSISRMHNACQCTFVPWCLTLTLIWSCVCKGIYVSWCFTWPLSQRMKQNPLTTLSRTRSKNGLNSLFNPFWTCKYRVCWIFGCTFYWDRMLYPSPFPSNSLLPNAKSRSSGNQIQAKTQYYNPNCFVVNTICCDGRADREIFVLLEYPGKIKNTWLNLADKSWSNTATGSHWLGGGL